MSNRSFHCLDSTLRLSSEDLTENSVSIFSVGRFGFIHAVAIRPETLFFFKIFSLRFVFFLLLRKMASHTNSE